MSGMAYAAPTTPGSVATFCSCSSELSWRIAPSSSSSANTRAGTRMSGRASAGISYVVVSIQRPSNIEHNRCKPTAAALLERQPVVRRRLRDRVERRAPSLDDDAAAGDLGAVGDEALRVGQVDQLLEQRDEPGGVVCPPDADVEACGLAVSFELDQPSERL